MMLSVHWGNATIVRFTDIIGVGQAFIGCEPSNAGDTMGGIR